MTKKKVLILGPLPPPCMGPAIATQIILGSRLNEYFNLIHLDTNTHDRLGTLATLSPRGIAKNALLYAKMTTLVVRRRPDLIVIPISQTTMGFLKDSIFILIGRLFSRKILLQLRGGNFRNWLGTASAATNAYVSLVLGLAAGIIVLGNNLRDLFADYFPADRIFVVPNGADYGIVPHFDKGSEKIRILYVGNLQASKGIEDVIAAALLLKQDFNTVDFELHVVGEWFSDGIRESVLDTVNKHDLPIRFHGVAVGEKKLSFLTEADLFVFPPREPEGHPWVIIEAMAAGLPIISTDQGAIKESVIDGVNGFIVGVKSPEQIAEKIQLLADNAELRKKMGVAGRKLYEERFTQANMVRNMKECFERVLAR